jgi:NNP family nitrate/nitrite transporter-like MFS transporter
MTNYECPNPNAPDSSAIAWLGAFVGSLIHPVGEVLADKHGSAKVTMIAIVWCTTAAFAQQGVLVAKTRELDQPEHNFGLFVFFVLNLSCSAGPMNDAAFRIPGDLSPQNYQAPCLSGPMLGWWSSAVISHGAFIIPTMFGIALKAGKPETVFFCLGGHCVACAVLNFWCHLPPGCKKPGVWRFPPSSHHHHCPSDSHHNDHWLLKFAMVFYQAVEHEECGHSAISAESATAAEWPHSLLN